MRFAWFVSMLVLLVNVLLAPICLLFSVNWGVSCL